MPTFSWGKWFYEKIFHQNYLCTHFPRKELIVLYFHNFCAKHPKYEEILSFAFYLQQQFPFRQPLLLLPENSCQFPLQCLDGALPPGAGAARAPLRLRLCPSGCCTAGEMTWTLPRSAYRQKKGKTYNRQALEAAKNWPWCVFVVVGFCLFGCFLNMDACRSNLDYLEVM